MDFVNELLETEPYSSSFTNYTHIPNNLWNKVPLGSHIKYLDKDNEIRSAGFLIRFVDDNVIENRMFVIKNNRNYFYFHFFYYNVFYKDRKFYAEKRKPVKKKRKKRVVKEKNTVDKEKNTVDKELTINLDNLEITTNKMNNCTSNIIQTNETKVNTKPKKITKEKLFKKILDAL